MAYSQLEKEFPRGGLEALRQDILRVGEQQQISITTQEAKEFCAALYHEPLTSEERAFIKRWLPQLEPLLQGPIYLGDGIVIPGVWDLRGKWQQLQLCLPPDLSGKRVLDIGCNAGLDSLRYSTLGADYVLGIEPYDFYYQALFLKEVFKRDTVDFQKIGWQQLSPETHGLFDVVNCLGIVYHERSPMQLLDKLAAMTCRGGLLILESHILVKPEYSSMAKFIEGSFWGDSTYWWIFGVECLSGMLRSSGFTEVEIVSQHVCESSRNPKDPNYTVEGHYKEARGIFKAIRA